MDFNQTPSVPSGCQSCAVCGVKVDQSDTVHFSFGKPGSRERLYARVCKHVGDERCINKDQNALEAVTDNDRYGLPEKKEKSLDTVLATAQVGSLPLR